MNVTDQKYTTNQADAMATITKKITPDLNFSARLGVSLNQRYRKGTTATYSNMTVTDVISINSYQDKSIEENNIRRRSVRLTACSPLVIKAISISMQRSEEMVPLHCRKEQHLYLSICFRQFHLHGCIQAEQQNIVFRQSAAHRGRK